MSPRDLPAEKTAAFLVPLLAPGARVLEVGCGEGLLAARLSRQGFRVRALDSDPHAVEAARARGVDALSADFHDYEDDPFDAVLFTRSLHHIGPLDAALEHALALLAPEGILVAEEFAREAVDAATAAWFYGRLEGLEKDGLLRYPERLASRLPDPLARWGEDHLGEDLATGAAMREALARRFVPRLEAAAGYLYRYFCDALEETPRGLAAAREVTEEEEQGIAQGRLAAAGLRLVATPGRAS